MFPSCSMACLHDIGLVCRLLNCWELFSYMRRLHNYVDIDSAISQLCFSLCGGLTEQQMQVAIGVRDWQASLRTWVVIIVCTLCTYMYDDRYSCLTTLRFSKAPRTSRHCAFRIKYRRRPVIWHSNRNCVFRKWRNMIRKNKFWRRIRGAYN